MQKLVAVAVIAGGLACLPALYEAKPDFFHALLAPADENAAAPKQREQGHVAASANALSGRRFSVRADARGHFLAEFRLNGRTVRSMVDTGATVIAINRSTARHIGLRLAESDFRHEVSTANGSARAAEAMIGRVQLGRIDIGDLRAVVLDDDALAMPLIGVNFLNRLSRYRVEGGTLFLEQ